MLTLCLILVEVDDLYTQRMYTWGIYLREMVDLYTQCMYTHGIYLREMDDLYTHCSHPLENIYWSWGLGRMWKERERMEKENKIKIISWTINLQSPSDVMKGWCSRLASKSIYFLLLFLCFVSLFYLFPSIYF